MGKCVCVCSLVVLVSSLCLFVRENDKSQEEERGGKKGNARCTGEIKTHKEAYNFKYDGGLSVTVSYRVCKLILVHRNNSLTGEQNSTVHT